MAFSFVFDVEAASTNNNSATTGSVDTTGATFIVIECNHDNASAVAPTDSKGNTWTAHTRYKSSAPGTQFYSCVNPTVGSGHTFTLSSTSNYPSLGVIGFSTATDAAIDQQNGATTTGSSTLASGSITPSKSSHLRGESTKQNGERGFTNTAGTSSLRGKTNHFTNRLENFPIVVQ